MMHGNSNKKSNDNCWIGKW